MRDLLRRDPEIPLAAGLLAALALAPLVVESWRLLDLAVYLSYATLAVSLAFVWGHVGLLSLGHAVFFGLGAYTMSFATLGLVPGADALPSWIGILGAMAVPAGAGYVLGWFIFRSGRIQEAFFGVMTLAIAVIAEKVFVNWDYAGGLNGLLNVPSFKDGIWGGEEIVDERAVFFMALAVFVASYALLARLIRSDAGLVLAAIRSHQTRTEAFGFDVAARKTRAYAISAAIAGLAGGMFVTQFNFASPTLIGFGLSAEALIWVALGGRRFLLSAALGAMLLRYLEGNVTDVFGEYWKLLLGVFFVAVVMWFPNGVFGGAIEALRRRVVDRR